MRSTLLGVDGAHWTSWVPTSTCVAVLHPQRDRLVIG
jgi:hypothetical protein